jgi:RNA polymerase sigma-70 factor (ECF subfamily)
MVSFVMSTPDSRYECHRYIAARVVAPAIGYDTRGIGNWASGPVLGGHGVRTDVTLTQERRVTVTAERLARARAGDGEAFGALTEPHRRELQVHCYRMLGSVQDAEDALQDTLMAAWRGLAGFQERSTLRAWLYRVATNRCLNALRAARRRPTVQPAVPEFEPPEPSQLGEVLWLEPYPDALLDGIADAPGPEARYELTEAISLAFLTALQLMPPRQRAVLILRDVLGYHASEVAEMLDTTVESVTSALKRARAAIHRYRIAGRTRTGVAARAGLSDGGCCGPHRTADR